MSSMPHESVGAENASNAIDEYHDMALIPQDPFVTTRMCRLPSFRVLSLLAVL